MSKIQTELFAATGLKPVRNEERQACIARIMKAVAALDDDGWDGLSQQAQDWFNEAADAQNAKKKTLPDFPDMEEPAKEEPAKPASRRGAAKSAPAETERLTKVGDTATVTTKRGKEVTGVVVEIDDEVVVLEVDGDEQEFNMDRVESVSVTHGTPDADDGDADDGPSLDLKVGMMVVVTTKRGKTVTGEIVEIDDEVVVLDVDGKDEEFDRARVESIEPVGKAVKEEPAKPAGRRGSAAKEEPAKEEKTKRASNEGVSIGTRIKELIADDLDATEADISKILKKEGLEFRENTLKLNFVDAHKFITILKAKKLIK